jgi:hypothetical protein
MNASVKLTQNNRTTIDRSMVCDRSFVARTKSLSANGNSATSSTNNPLRLSSKRRETFESIEGAKQDGLLLRDVVANHDQIRRIALPSNGHYYSNTLATCFTYAFTIGDCVFKLVSFTDCS